MDELNAGSETQPPRKKNINLSIKDFLLVAGMIVLLCFSGASIWANRQLSIKVNKLEAGNAEMAKEIKSIDFDLLDQQSDIDDLKNKADQAESDIDDIRSYLNY